LISGEVHLLPEPPLVVSVDTPEDMISDVRKDDRVYPMGNARQSIRDMQGKFASCGVTAAENASGILALPRYEP
jgi:hypothetical protein